MDKIVRSVIEELRVPFQADGGDLEVVNITKDMVKIRIVIGPSTCRECLMPTDIIQKVLASAIKEQLGREVKVSVEVHDLG